MLVYFFRQLNVYTYNFGIIIGVYLIGTTIVKYLNCCSFRSKNAPNYLLLSVCS